MPGEGRSQGPDEEASKCEDWSRQRGDWAERLSARQKKTASTRPRIEQGGVCECMKGDLAGALGFQVGPGPEAEH